ncbi:MAG: DUF4011 domain-containing protein [Lachnospiraceae bacterium]|nr:DUF4011 domain-containing protein [Lachnospiraceae bacterium]
MADRKKLERWAEKLFDTGKRNNLINYKDSKTTSAEILHPDCESIFSRCAVGRVFEVFDPGIPDPETEEMRKDMASGEAGGEAASGQEGEEMASAGAGEGTASVEAGEEMASVEEGVNESVKTPGDDKKNGREAYKERYGSRMKSDRCLLAYAKTPNPITAVKNIAKKAKEMQDETGINAAYLAFGFLKWREKETSEFFYRAPLLLVHVNLLTGSILDPVKIEVSDDDVVVNPTFGFYLQTEYGLTLPSYEDGEPLDAYYDKVLGKLRGMGWEILDECRLGIFSFLKINMYEDLKKNADRILENRNVRVLMGEALPDAGRAAEPAAEKKVLNPLIDLHTVVDADSSQIEAIEMAKSGKSFVLQGPPGTGKSQTITNIIAECLHDGRKVLFVSEKQAALNVVFEKLKKAGLGDFCLELHSHKANKKAVIDELNRTLLIPKSVVSSGAQEEIRQKEEAQLKLDAYAAELHRKREVIDRSLYQLFELHSEQRKMPDLPFAIRGIRDRGQDYLLQAVRLLEQYAEYVPTIGADYRQNPWYGFEELSIDYEGRAELKADLALLTEGFTRLGAAAAGIRDSYETPELHFSDTKRWQAILDYLASSDVVTPSLLSREALRDAYPRLEAMKESSERLLPIRDRLLQAYHPELLEEADGKELYTRLTGEFSSLFARLFSGEYRDLTAALRRLRKDGGKLSYQKALELSEQLMGYQAAAERFEENAAAAGYLGPCYKGADTDWGRVMDSLKVLEGLFEGEGSSFGAISRMSPECFAERKGVFRKDAERLLEGIEAVDAAAGRVGAKFDKEALDLETDSYEKCVSKLEGCREAFEKLGNWISFAGLLGKLREAELTDYVELVIREGVRPDEVSGAYRKAFYKQWIENIIYAVPELASFSRIRQDLAVQEFGRKDELQYEISKLQIQSELSQLRPNLDMVAGGSAVSILRREGSKKRKQMPIRRLLTETGSLTQLLKPCFLMSPLSVSTFLDPEKLHFDTVIFDEASQIFPQDAIGAIYRGEQLIVVGDSRQMPPSNFFNAAVDIDEEDEELGDIGDFESILDVCSSVFTTVRLAWHYRSHYEQLIAFSNLNFYSNSLVTFPSSSKDRKGIGVDYYFVDGIFDRKSKTNKAEAQFIVDLIFRNIEEYPERSLGVVAFSASQQRLIDLMLSRKREEDPSREWFFKSDREEPFFIKNLETVQGDERDTIIFSVAYAKDSQGRFIQNFGPLNREGGERRLNVAVTRAKDNVQLVSSIRYTDINLGSTESEGVRLLRAYLDYAQNGEQALERALTVRGGDSFDSHFEQEVCDFLREEGFCVDTQVGCSGYRIDLGLRKPDSSNYRMAIECDGASYHSFRNARDRDSIRQRVLERMGWKFYRIWSTDWYRNKSVEKERLLQAAKDALSESDDPKETLSESSPERTLSAAEDAEERFVREITETPAEFPPYRQLDAMELLRKNRYSLQAGIRELLETEAPLSEEFLLKRIVGYFEREKVTRVVLDEYKRRMFRCENMGILRRNGFLYLEGKDAVKLRIPGVKREIRYISIEELAGGLAELIEQNVTANREGLYKTLANLLGFSRIGDAIAARFEEALEFLKEQGSVKEEEGILYRQAD